MHTFGDMAESTSQLSPRTATCRPARLQADFETTRPRIGQTYKLSPTKKSPPFCHLITVQNPTGRKKGTRSVTYTSLTCLTTRSVSMKTVVS